MILIFSFSTTFSQENKEDSLINLLRVTSQEDTIRFRILIALGSFYKNVDLDKGKEYLYQGLDLANRKKRPFWRAMFQSSLIQYLTLQDKTEESIVIGLAAVRTFDSLSRKDQSLITQSILIPIFSSRGYYEKALEMSLNSLEQVKDDPETPSKGRYYFNVANSYRHLEVYDNALLYYQQALRISKRTNFRPGVAVISLNIALCKIELGYYREAHDLLKTELAYFKEVGNKSLTATTHEYLGNLAVQEGGNSLAIRNYEAAIALYEDLAFAANVQDLSNKLYIQYSIAGQIDLAKKAQENYELLRDSLQKEEITKIVGELQTKYETEKKESEIAALKQDSEIQSLRIRQRNMVIVFSLLAFMLIVVAIVFRNRQKNAAKRRKQIELEQRFLRSQLNPHFISNALVAVQSSLMDSNVEEANTYLSTFSRLMREILEHSRQESIPVEDEVAMLNDYLEINQKRLKGQLDYAISVDEDIDEEFDQVPPMIIQPFIENTMEHGVPPKNEAIQVEVKLKKENEAIQVTILDNGGGISEHTSNDSRSLSTQIIQERIALLNESLKREIILNMENWEHEDQKTRGLKVTLSLPLL